VIALAAAALLLAAPSPGCAQARAAAGLAPEALAEQALELCSRAAAGGPGRGLERAARELADAAPAERPQLGARFRAALEAHCRLAESPRSASRVGAAEREELARILSQPRFARARLDRSFPARWLARLWSWLLDLLGTGEAEKYASGGRTAFFAAVATAGALLAARALRRRAARRRLPRPGEPRVEPPRAAATLEDAPADGDPVERVRAALLLALGTLERAGALPEGRALTNREMARRLATTAPAASAQFARLAGAFDRAVYGGARPEPGEAAACVAAARDLALALAGDLP
jgi:hypothetical protein